jgi:hypothetical protein
MEKAFFETYGISLHDILGEERPAMRSYRSAVRSFIPFFGRGEVVLHRHSFPADQPDHDFELYSAEFERASFRKYYAHAYAASGFLAHVSAVLIRILPPLGATAMLHIKIPNQETQQLYARSINETLTHYRKHLEQVGTNGIQAFALVDRDLDTGTPVRPGGYKRTDDTYAKLLHAVVTRSQMTIPLGLKEDVLAYYSNPDAPISTKQHPKAWAQVQQELERFKTMKAGTKLVIPREDD